MNRRHLLAAAVAAGAAGPLGVAGRGHAGPGLIRVPRPTGPHRVGRVSLHLVDGARELMADVWYPAERDGRRYPGAPWLPVAPLRAMLAGAGIDAGAVRPPVTSACSGAPVLRGLGRVPVVLYSHGSGSCRGEATVVAQELVSHGYVVVAADHPGNGYTEFPDGRVGVDDAESYTPWDAFADDRFTLDSVARLAAGRNPDAGRRPLPAGLGELLDLRRIGMLGWSKGATATALMMNQDRRVRAGISLDGPLECQPPIEAVDRPFLLMTSEHSRTAAPSVEDVWAHRLTGWKLNLHVKAAAHGSYIDIQWLMPELAKVSGMDAEELASWVGTWEPARAVRVQQAYPLAFFDLHLRGGRGRLLAGPSAAFPEVCFLA